MKVILKYFCGLSKSFPLCTKFIMINLVILVIYFTCLGPVIASQLVPSYGENSVQCSSACKIQNCRFLHPFVHICSTLLSNCNFRHFQTLLDTFVHFKSVGNFVRFCPFLDTLSRTSIGKFVHLECPKLMKSVKSVTQQGNVAVADCCII